MKATEYQLTSPAQQELVDEQKRIAKQNWLNNVAAKDCIDDLRDLRTKNLQAAEALSVINPPDFALIIRHLIQAQTLKQTIDRILKI